MKPLRKGWLAQDDTVHLTENSAQDKQIELELIDWMRLKFNDKIEITDRAIQLISSIIAKERLTIERILNTDI